MILRGSVCHLAAPALVSALCNCGGEDPIRLGVSRHPAIYGQDSRFDVFEYPDEQWQALAQLSVVALVRAGKDGRWDGWQLCDPAEISPAGAQTVAEEENLCPSERFAEQPAAGNCSGTLIDTDLVVTASHCIIDEEVCRATRVVFGYLYDAPDQLHPISSEQVYSCRQRVAQPEGTDVVVIQLDRPVVETFRPATPATKPAKAGDPLVVIGFPLGMPMKIIDDCAIQDVYAGLYLINCDGSRGNSGSGVFDQQRQLVGIYTSGAGGLRPSDQDDCNVYALYTQEGQLEGIPTAPQWGTSHPWAPAGMELCDGGWPTPLCSQEPDCGDGLCSGGETDESCSADCAAPSCGDGVCNLAEEYGCEADCGARDLPADCGFERADAGPDARAGEDGEAGDDSDKSEGAGCSCELAGAERHGDSFPVMLAVFTVALTSRRRRRSPDERACQSPVPTCSERTHS